ncbi:MAG TPA: hypothetical protein VHN11_12015 [Xanthobacteraceae bacterium]|jgi:hypothetical protein|nr:hypothetical protein [Xanthobacteraceae bacterium]
MNHLRNAMISVNQTTYETSWRSKLDVEDTRNIIPVSDEQAKAAQEALKTLQGVGRFLKDTFGTIPQDVVGMLGGDYLRVRRAENLVRTIEKARKRLDENGIETPDASPSLAIPIMIAAADESRDDLQDIWAALLEAAATPKKSKAFRLKFIELAKELDPFDALTLKGMYRVSPNDFLDDAVLAMIAEKIGGSRDQVRVSVANLEATGMIIRPSGNNSRHYVALSPLAREFLLAVQ